MKELKKYFPILLGLIITTLFALVYLHNHAFGAWGDDSPGYIAMTGRLVQGQPLVYQDTLAQQGLNVFEDERLARWLRPVHYEFINPDGWMAPRYPIGIAFILGIGAIMAQNLAGMYLVVPLLAAINVGLVFWLTALMMHFSRYRWLLAVISAWALGITTLYYELALSQPMREIPTLTFILITTLALIYWQKRLATNTVKKTWWLLVISAIALGIAMNIRETAAVLLPGIMIYISATVRAKKYRAILRSLGLYLTTIVIVLLPTIYMAIRLDTLQAPFKRRDVTLPTVVPNIDHITSIGLRNMFNDYGKFRPGHGALPHYWSVMSDITPVPWFLFFALLGGVLLWQYAKKETWLLVSWLLSILFMFSIWINPYSRYIIPLFPTVIILGCFGVVQLLDLLLSYLPLKKFQFFIVTGIVVIGSVVLYQPAFAKLRHHFTTDTYYSKSISHRDLNSLIALGEKLKNNSPAPLVVFTGAHHGLPEVFTTHTNIRTVTLPLESRFSPTPEQLHTFFADHILPNYTVYVWVDSTTDQSAKNWLGEYNQTLVRQDKLSFGTDAQIIQLINN